jgi:hypothetical protein
MVSETRKTGSVGWKGEWFHQSPADNSVLAVSACWTSSIHLPAYPVVCGHHVRLNNSFKLTVRQGTQIMST